MTTRETKIEPIDKRGNVGFSSLTDQEIYDYENNFGAHHYGRLNTVIRKAEGAWLYTQDGRKILDCLAAYSAANAGHHHPKIVAAAVEALQGHRSEERRVGEARCYR